jgi:hypothetical protein
MAGGNYLILVGFFTGRRELL